MTVPDTQKRESARVRGKPFPVGNRANPGGRPKKLVEIEAMLDQRHRTVENMSEVFDRLKALAMGEVVTVPDGDGGVDVKLQADARFMALYLDRILGPVREQRVDLSDLPDNVVQAIAERLPAN